MVVDEPMAMTIINVRFIIFTPIWYELTDAAPNAKTIMPATTKALASINIWNEMGIPTFNISAMRRNLIIDLLNRFSV